MHKANEGLKDLSLREWVVMLPLILSIFVLGLRPNLVLDHIEPGVDNFLKQHAQVVHQTRNPGVNTDRFYLRVANPERAAKEIGARMAPKQEALRVSELSTTAPKVIATSNQTYVDQRNGGLHAP